MIVFRIPMGFLVNLRIAISKRVEITFSKIPMEKYLSKKKSYCMTIKNIYTKIFTMNPIKSILLKFEQFLKSLIEI